jgi:hypothetical protein
LQLAQFVLVPRVVQVLPQHAWSVPQTLSQTPPHNELVGTHWPLHAVVSTGQRHVPP